MLGVVISSACMVLVVTVALTGKKYVGRTDRSCGIQYRLCGPRAIQRFAEHVLSPIKSHTSDLEAVKAEYPASCSVAGTNDVPMSVVADGKARPVSLVGVTGSFRKFAICWSRAAAISTTAIFRREQGLPAVRTSGAGSFARSKSEGQTIQVGELSFSSSEFLANASEPLASRKSRTIPS